MKKEFIIKYIFFFLLLLISGVCLRSDRVSAGDVSKDEKITTINPKENTLEKILFIKNGFEKNIKYTSIEDENVFRSILIGFWKAPPHGMIEFRSDGKFESKNYEDNKSMTGFWEFYDGALRTSPDKKRWEIYKVKEYRLNFHDLSRAHKYGRNWDSGVYAFSIRFDKMVCDMSGVLAIDFYTK